MEKQHIVVELVQPEVQREQQSKIEDLQRQLKALQVKYQKLEVQYGFETYLNNELCDLCRAHGVSFRPALEHAKRMRGGDGL